MTVFASHYLCVKNSNILTKVCPFRSVILGTKDVSQGLNAAFPLKLVWRSPYCKNVVVTPYV